jgi:hypothetical protein
VDGSAPAPRELERLWDGAFSGGARAKRDQASRLFHRAARSFPRRSSVHGADGWSRPRIAVLQASVALGTPLGASSARHVVVKSVFSALSLRWICSRWNPRLVVVSKSALNTVASWRRLGWKRPFAGEPVLSRSDGTVARVLAGLAPGYELPPPPPEQTLERLTWELCALRLATLAVQQSNPAAIAVRHEDVCADPPGHLRELFGELGLEWSDDVERYIARADAPGQKPYDTRRVAREEAERWRGRLSADEARQVRSVVDSFGFDW